MCAEFRRSPAIRNFRLTRVVHNWFEALRDERAKQKIQAPLGLGLETLAMSDRLAKVFKSSKSIMAPASAFTSGKMDCVW